MILILIISKISKDSLKKILILEIIEGGLKLSLLIFNLGLFRTSKIYKIFIFI